MTAASIEMLSDAGAYVRHGEDGTASLYLMVEGAHCAHCIQRIEGALRRQPGVLRARLNLSTRRLYVAWGGGGGGG
jgi:P-type Cu2+ transporter